MKRVISISYFNNLLSKIIANNCSVKRDYIIRINIIQYFHYLK